MRGLLPRGMRTVVVAHALCTVLLSQQTAMASSVSSAAPLDVPFAPMTTAPSSSPDGLPFVFVHQMKCAGSTMREVLFNWITSPNATAIDLRPDDACVPCGRVGSGPKRPCKVFHERDCTPGDTDAPLAIVAGHFEYRATVNGLIRRNHLPPKTVVPCLTYIRRPVTR